MADGHIAARPIQEPIELDRGTCAVAAAPATHEHPVLDKLGIGVSLTCAVHCIASALLSVVPALAGHTELLESMELPLLVMAAIVGTLSLVPAARAHGHRGPVTLFGAGIVLLLLSRLVPDGAPELVLTVGGFTPVALAHLWNLRLCHH